MNVVLYAGVVFALFTGPDTAEGPTTVAAVVADDAAPVEIMPRIVVDGRIDPAMRKQVSAEIDPHSLYRTLPRHTTVRTVSPSDHLPIMRMGRPHRHRTTGVGAGSSIDAY